MTTSETTGKELLARVRELIKAEGGAGDNDKSPEDEILKYVLPSLQNTKDILSDLNKDVFTKGGGLKGKVKHKVMTKVGNIARNVLERSLMKQQKYNDNLLLLFEYLLKSNLELRERIEQLEKH
jgi:hypothetical protein